MKSIDVKLIVDENRQFADEKTGQIRIYTGYSLQIGTASVNIAPSKRDRALLEYLLANVK